MTKEELSELKLAVECLDNKLVKEKHKIWAKKKLKDFFMYYKFPISDKDEGSGVDD